MENDETVVASPSPVEDVTRRFALLLRDNFPSAKSEFSGAASLREIGLDSLDVVDLVWTIETEFGIKFTDDELQAIISLDALAELVVRKSGS